MTLMQQIQSADSIEKLELLSYQVETGEEGAAVSLREAQLLGRRPTYRQMVTKDGRFVPANIIGFAHRRARDEFDAHVRAAGAANPFRYAELLARELINAWGWAHAIRDARQGEAPAFALPMFDDALAA